MTKKQRELASKWEAALPRKAKPSPGDLLKALRKVDPAQLTGNEDVDEELAKAEFEAAISPCHLGSISLDFPNSMHGDGCSVDVCVLPGGTTVLTPYATYERDCPPFVVYRGSKTRDMLALADDLLFDDGDYGEIQDLDEDDTYDPDVNTTYEGEEALVKKWERTIRKATR